MVLTYAVFAAAWLLLAEKVVAWLFQGTQFMALAGFANKLAFIAVTSCVLHLWLRRPSQSAMGADGAAVGACAMYMNCDAARQKRFDDEMAPQRKHLDSLVDERTRQLQDALAHTAAASRAKSAFLANMSHEIRTPLNAIIGLADLLRGADLCDEHGHYLERIDTSARHLLAVLDDLLDISRIEAGKLQLQPADFDLMLVLDNVCALIGQEAHDKGLVVRVDAAGVPMWLRGDPMRLQQALLNYASNAVKFTSSGAIDISVRVEREGGPALQLRFEVKDSGVGIAADMLPRLFQAFEQLDASSTRQHGGSGLGLAITRSLAQLMGGEAGVRSTLGQGSTFWFTAWLSRPSAGRPDALGPEADAAAAIRARHAGARVLLVEDNAINREVAEAMLRNVGLVVESAHNGQVALDMASAGASDHYALVLMDVQMPVMDGLEATRRIRALPGWSRRPIVAISANASTEDREACLRAGMDAFIAKPVVASRLHDVLLQWL